MKIEIINAFPSRAWEGEQKKCFPSFPSSAWEGIVKSTGLHNPLL